VPITQWITEKPQQPPPNVAIVSSRLENALAGPMRIREKMHEVIGLGQVDERGGIVVPPWYVATSTAATAAGAYHGYKRNHSVGWAIVWALLSGPFWPVAVPVMLAQGFGKPKRTGGGYRRHTTSSGSRRRYNPAK
jgi:hypothetical protein